MDVTNNKEEKFSESEKAHDKEVEKEPEKEKNKDLDKENSSTPSEPRGNAVFRQELTSLTPECGFQCALICNIILILVFIGLGVPIIMFTRSITEYVIDYSDW